LVAQPLALKLFRLKPKTLGVRHRQAAEIGRRPSTCLVRSIRLLHRKSPMTRFLSQENSETSQRPLTITKCFCGRYALWHGPLYKKMQQTRLIQQRRKCTGKLWKQQLLKRIGSVGQTIAQATPTEQTYRSTVKNNKKGPRAQRKTNKEGQQTTTDYKKNCERAENGDSTKKPTDVRNETNYGSIDLWKTCRIGQFKTKFNPAKEIGLHLSETLEHRHQPQYVRPEIEKQKPDCMS